MFRRIFLVLAVLGAVALAGSASTAQARHGCYRSSYYGHRGYHGGHSSHYRNARYYGHGPSYYRGGRSHYYGGHHGHHGHHGHSGVSLSFGF